MTVLYHSKSGNTKQMAEFIADGMITVESTEAKAFPIEEIDWARAKKQMRGAGHTNLFGEYVRRVCTARSARAHMLFK